MKNNGSGYPDGLRGEEIPIAAQVVSLTDAYDILVSERAYKKGILHREAVRYILDGKSGAFNPILLECLIDAQGRIQRELGSQIISEIKFDCCPKLSYFVEK